MLKGNCVYECEHVCLTSRQQLRSYEDVGHNLSLIQETGGASDQTSDPWFTM